MKTERIILYSPYERIWHWAQALSIALLFLSGLEIHSPGGLTIFGFARAVRVHNFLGFLVLANAFLGLFFYLTTGKIRQYLPEPRDFITLSIQQAQYYLHGIFEKAVHPIEKTPHRRLNPLQQVTYLMILNILLPLQVITGLLIWGGQRWPEVAGAVGGLPVLTMIHTLVAWLFVAFVIAHIYLTTTGHKPLSNLKAMLLGWEDLPVHETAAAGSGKPGKGPKKGKKHE
jgi:thiosulfate reductase cytochrome b subunit